MTAYRTAYSRSVSAGGTLSGSAVYIIGTAMFPNYHVVTGWARPEDYALQHGAIINFEMWGLNENGGLTPDTLYPTHPISGSITLISMFNGTGVIATGTVGWFLTYPGTATIDLTGSWEVTYPTDEESETTITAAWAQYGGGSVADLPYHTDQALRLRMRPGGTLSTRFTIGGTTVTLDETIPDPAPVALYDVYHGMALRSGLAGASTTCGGSAQYCSGTMGASYTATDAAGQVTVGNGLSVTVTAGGHEASGNSGLRRPRLCQVEGAIQAFNAPWAGSGSVRMDVSAAGTATPLPITGGAFSQAIEQHKWSASHSWDGGAATGTAVDEDHFLRCWLDGQALIDNGEDTYDWRILLHGRNWNAITLTQAGSAVVDDGSGTAPTGDYAGGWVGITNTTIGTNPLGVTLAVSGGPGTADRTFTPSGGGLSGYRYLRVCGSASVNDSAYGVKIGVKEWTTDYQGAALQWQTSGTIAHLIDLCNPTNGTTTWDAFDTRWPSPTNDDNILGDGCYWGVQSAGTIRFTGLEDGSTYTVASLQLVRQGETRASWHPAFRRTEPEADSSARRRLLIGQTDGRQSIEETDASISSAGAWSQRTIDHMVDDVNAIDTGGINTGVRNPGWTAAHVAASDVADGAEYTDWLNNYLNRNRPSTWLMGGGMWYQGTPGWGTASDVNYGTATITVPGQMLFDTLDWYPDCPDSFGLTVAGTAGTAGTLTVGAGKLMRGRAWGLVIDDATGLPDTGSRVEVWQVAAGLAGTASTDSQGWYVTGDPYGKGYRVHRVYALDGNPPGTVTGTLYGRKSKRACFRISATGEEWVSYDVSDAGRHVHAYVRDGSVTVGFASDIHGETWTQQACFAGSCPQVRYDRWRSGQPVWIAYDSGGVLLRQYSLNEGASWTMAGTITAAGKWPNLEITRDGRHCYYWYNAGTINGVILDAFGGTVVAPFNTGITSDDDEFDVREYTTGQGVWRMKLTYRAGGAIVDVNAPDGVMFS